MACGDNGPYNDQATLYDIVTFDGNSPAGAKFSFCQYDDSPQINLLAPGISIEANDIIPGKRLLIGYCPTSGVPYQSGDITLEAYSPINQDTVKIVPHNKVNGWDTHAIYLNSVWRAGQYLNLHLLLDHADEPRRFEMIADQSTINDEMPHLYLAHDMHNCPENYTRRTYASFDLRPIWQLGTCRGIIVHINDRNHKNKVYTYLKTTK